MPELPEVETIVNDLNRKIKGRRFLGLVWCDNVKAVEPSLAAVKKQIKNKKIKKIERRAKLIIFHLSNSDFLIIHLKLTGRLLVRKKGEPKDQYQHVVFALSGRTELRFADLRKFGFIKYVENQKELDKILKEFGPEPLAKNFTPQNLGDILSKRSVKIKQALMDQSLLAGIGNIYSDEALWCARIDPRRPAKSLSFPEVTNLLICIRKILKEGISHRGTSDNMYLDTAGKKGSYQNHLEVYGQEEKKCSRCGSLIKRFKLGGRSGHFCAKCQK